MVKSFLGTGVKFPFQIDNATGRLAMSSRQQLVKESVYIILMTNIGERWLEPQFGADLLSYTFMDMSSTMLNIMSREIKEVIYSQEPRISNVEVEIEQGSADGCLIVNLIYTIAGENKQDNLVFPFYLKGTDNGEA